MTRSLPIIMPQVENQKFDCKGCTRCCRDLVVHLFPADRRRIDEQGWRDRLTTPPYVRSGRSWVLNKRDDGACVFLTEEGRCAIHAKHGISAKPLACRLYPFTLRRFAERWDVSIRFDCPTVARSAGLPLVRHHDELARVADALTESLDVESEVIELRSGVTAAPDEARCVLHKMDRLFDLERPTAGEFQRRLRVAAFVTDMLSGAKLAKVRGTRFAELVQILFEGAADEVAAMPTSVATKRQRMLLRQLAFAYRRRVTLSQITGGVVSKARLIFGQLRDSGRFRRGHGRVPNPDGSESQVRFETIEEVKPASGRDADDVAELVSRYLRTRLGTGTVCAGAYYNWPLFDGLQALWLAVVVLAWTARLESATDGRDRITLQDVVSALATVDGAAGRLPALGVRSERLRTRFLTSGAGMQGLFTAFPLVQE